MGCPSPSHEVNLVKSVRLLLLRLQQIQQISSHNDQSKLIHLSLILEIKGKFDITLVQ